MKHLGAVLLTLLTIGLLVANSADFLFRQAYHEVWDSATNSLSVIRAKRFAQLYGPYSRWGFYHPGPTLFYVQAFGEWLFHDTLRWTRTPFPAQTLAHATVMSGFFVAALTIFSRWLPAGRPRWWFLCGALALAIPHFAAMHRIPSYDVLRGPSAFLSMWSAHALVLPFLCLLTAGASVAAGRGGDLPVLALASGYLLQLHVAQPMFVFPVFTLAYGALLWRAANGTSVRPLGPVSFWRRTGRHVGAAWREFPRAHVVAGLILAFFAVPFLVDFCRGTESNLAAILRHVRTHDTHKPFERAWFYFLHFGAYTAYNPVDNEFAAYDRAGLLAFLRAHAALYALWALVAALVVWALSAGLWRQRRRRRRLTSGQEENEAEAGVRFRMWAAVCWCLVVALTLRWNVRQDEQMFYFNAWFTFAIYHFGALIALAVVVCALLARDPSSSSPGEAVNLGRRTLPLPLRERLVGVAAVLAVAGWWADGLRLTDPSPAATRAMSEDIRRLEAASRLSTTDAAAEGSGLSPAKMLYFEYDTSPVAAAVALQLERDGVPFATEERWRVFLGENHRWSRLPERLVRAGRVQTWRFAHQPELAGGLGDTDLPVTTVPYLLDFFHAPDDIKVRCADPPVDPAAGPDGATVRFATNGNAPSYVVAGWSDSPESSGTWSDERFAMLGFRPAPVPETDGGSVVEITLVGLTPWLDPARGLDHQRLRVFFDGEPLGVETVLTRDVETLVYQVPVARWNHQAGSLSPVHPESHLLLELPDAVLRVVPDPTGSGPVQHRRVGVRLREVRFQVVPSAVVPVALPAVTLPPPQTSRPAE